MGIYSFLIVHPPHWVYMPPHLVNLGICINLRIGYKTSNLDRGGGMVGAWCKARAHQRHGHLKK